MSSQKIPKVHKPGSTFNHTAAKELIRYSPTKANTNDLFENGIEVYYASNSRKKYSRKSQHSRSPYKSVGSSKGSELIDCTPIIKKYITSDLQPKFLNIESFTSPVNHKYVTNSYVRHGEPVYYSKDNSVHYNNESENNIIIEENPEHFRVQKTESTRAINDSIRLKTLQDQVSRLLEENEDIRSKLNSERAQYCTIRVNNSKLENQVLIYQKECEQLQDKLNLLSTKSDKYISRDSNTEWKDKHTILEHKHKIITVTYDKLEKEYKKLVEELNVATDSNVSLKNSVSKLSYEMEYKDKVVLSFTEKLNVLESTIKKNTGFHEEYIITKSEQASFKVKNEELEKVNEQLCKSVEELNDHIDGQGMQVIESKKNAEVEKDIRISECHRTSASVSLEYENALIDLNKNMNELQSENSKLKSEIGEMLKSQTELSDENTKLKYEYKVNLITLESANSQINSNASYVDTMKVELAKLHKECDDNYEKIKDLKNDNQSYQYEMKILNNTNLGLSRKNEGVENESTKLNFELENCKSEITSYMTQIDSNTDSTKDLKEKLVFWERKFKRKSDKYTNLKSSLEKANINIEQLRDKIDEYIVTMQGQCNEITDWKNQANLKQIELDNFAKEISRFEALLSNYMNENKVVNNELNSLKIDLQKSENKRSEINYNLKVVTSSFSHKEHQVEAQQKIIKEKELSIKKLNEDLLKMYEEANNLKASIREKSSLNDRSNKELEIKREKVKDHKIKNDNLYNQLSQTETILNNANRENIDLKAIIGRLETQINSLQNNSRNTVPTLINSDGKTMDTETAQEIFKLQAQNEKDKMLRDLEKIQTQLDEKTRKIKKYKTREIESSDKIKTLEHGIHEIEESRNSLTNDFMSQVTELEETIKSLKNLIYNYETEIKNQKEELQTSHEINTDFQNQRSIRINKISELENIINSHNYIKECFEATIKSMENDNFAYENKIKDLDQKAEKAGRQAKQSMMERDAALANDEEQELNTKTLEREIESLKKKIKMYELNQNTKSPTIVESSQRMVRSSQQHSNTMGMNSQTNQHGKKHELKKSYTYVSGKEFD